MTTTELFSIAHRLPIIHGSEQCALCGGSCGNATRVDSVLSDSFTDWQHVHGDYLCAPCLVTLRADSRVDQPRLYSWILTERAALKRTKAHLAELRETCQRPPTPPYCIVLADSGQRHLLYRASVTYDAAMAGVDLEGERIAYLPRELSDRLETCGQIVAATAKGALSDFEPVGLAIALSEYWADWESIFERWDHVRNEPLSRLATFLIGGREECRVAFPSDLPPKLVKVKKGQHADNDASAVRSAAPAVDSDHGKVSPDPGGAGRSRREPGEPGLFG